MARRRMKDSLSCFLRLKDFVITAFYPYTTVVGLRMFEEDFNFETEADEVLDRFWNEILVELEKRKIFLDNKIAVRLKAKKPEEFRPGYLECGTLYCGCYDGRVSLGFMLWRDSEDGVIKFENEET